MNAPKNQTQLIVRGLNERFAQWLKELSDISANRAMAQQKIAGVLLAVRRAVVASFVHPETKMHAFPIPAAEVQRRTSLCMDLLFAKREQGWSTARLTDEIGALLLEALGGKEAPARRASVWGVGEDSLLPQG